jgi:hypothetical protein
MGSFVMSSQKAMSHRLASDCVKCPVGHLLLRIPGVALAVLVITLALSSYCAAIDVPVQIDIEPGECPNILSLRSRSHHSADFSGHAKHHGAEPNNWRSSRDHLSVAVFGSPTFNVLDVDLASVRLSRIDSFRSTVVDDGLGSSIVPPLPLGSVAPLVALSKFTVLPTSYQKQDEVGNCQIATNDRILLANSKSLSFSTLVFGPA